MEGSVTNNSSETTIGHDVQTMGDIQITENYLGGQFLSLVG